MVMVIKKVLANLVFTLSFLFLGAAQTHAATAVVTSTSGICGSTDYSLSTLEDITSTNVPSGNVYVKLNYQSTSPIELSLYVNNISSNQCDFVGSVPTSSDNWTLIGNIDSNISSDDIIIQGLNVGAAPYQAAVRMMVIPSSSVCQPTINCTVNYEGESGILQLDDSNIISGGTDQIAIYAIKPVSGVGVQTVSYYDLGEQKGQLYSTTTLKPFNRNYLDGGIHYTQAQVKLNNGESIFINKTINMGTDWSGSLLIRSLLYRYSGPAAFFIIIGFFVVIGLVILLITRTIYKKRRERKLHGLDNYKPLETTPTSSDDNIVVG
jgi:hypothetical protein